MPDYQKGKIYTIRCRDDDTLIYVGSTIQPLSVRWGGHKKDCKRNNPAITIVKLMQEKSIDMFYIELYEEYPCNSKEQLHKREGEITRLIGTVNKNIAGRTDAEYRKDNKQKIAEIQREYRKNHSTELAEQKKQYLAKNKEKVAERSKKYYEKHKEEMLARQKEKITCNHCGVLISRVNLERHKRTPKCFNVVSPVTLHDDDASAF